MQKGVNKRILFVDDEKDALSAYKTFFESLGYKVWTASDCDGALEVEEKISPDLLVIEYRLSGLGGLGVVKKIREKKRLIKIVLMTTGSREDIEDEFVGLDVAQIFEKPLSLSEFQKEIEHILE
jgi:DNA-binding response OmpR family regulator